MTDSYSRRSAVSLLFVVVLAALTATSPSASTVGSPPTDSKPPTAPTDVAVTPEATSAVRVTWRASADNVGVAGYEVRSRGRLAGRVVGLAFVVRGLQCGKSYRIAVVAFDGAGNRSSRRRARGPTKSCATSEPRTDTSSPSKPRGLRVAELGAQTISVVWLASRDDGRIAGYRLFRDGFQVASTTRTTATFGIFGCGETHEVGIQAVDSAGNLSSRTDRRVRTTPCGSGVVDRRPPTRPSGFVVTKATRRAVALLWRSSQDDRGVAGYGIYSRGRRVGTPALPRFVVGGLACGGSYRLRIVAIDIAGNHSPRAGLRVSTQPCAESTTAPPQTPSPTPSTAAPGVAEPDREAPTVPTNVRLASSTRTTLSITWSASRDNVGVAHYRLYRNGTYVGTTEGTGGTFSGLTCGRRYTLGVDAADAAGNRSPQAVVSASTSSCPTGGSDGVPPSTPVGLNVTGVTPTSVALAWAASSDNVAVVGYDVFVNGTRVGAASLPAYTAVSLTCGASYTIAVSAFDAAGNRSLRASVSATTSPCAVTPPPLPPVLPPSGGSTLYVSTGGSDANACTQAAPCRSFDRAYDIAAPGTTVMVAAGSYPSQDLTGSKASPGVVFDLGGAQVNEVEVYASWLEFRNGRVGSYRWRESSSPPDNVTFRNISANFFYMNGGSNISVIGGELGPNGCASTGYANINWIISDSGTPIRNVVLDGVTVHDNRTCLPGEHYEAIRIDRSAVGITIRNSRFERNEIFHVFITDSGFSEATVPRDITIENNTFDRPIYGGYAIKTQEPSVQTCTNYTIRNNRFANTGAVGLFCPSRVNVVVEGNTYG